MLIYPVHLEPDDNNGCPRCQSNHSRVYDRSRLQNRQLAELWSFAESFVRLGKPATIQKSFITRQLGAVESGEIDALRSILKRIFSS